MRYKAIHSVNLQISPDEAWNKLRDLSLAPLYVPGVKSMEFVTRIKEGKGAARIVYPQNLKEEVITWKPGKEVLLRLSKKGSESFFPFKKSVFRYSLEETGTTYMKLSLEYDPILGKLGHLLFGSIIQKRIIKTAENLKHYYEN